MEEKTPFYQHDLQREVACWVGVETVQYMCDLASRPDRTAAEQRDLHQLFRLWDIQRQFAAWGDHVSTDAR